MWEANKRVFDNTVITYCGRPIYYRLGTAQSEGVNRILVCRRSKLKLRNSDYIL